jgi:hypothetical protein
MRVNFEFRISIFEFDRRYALASGEDIGCEGDSMQIALLRKRVSGTGALLILIVILAALLGGCVVYEPVPEPSSYGSSYDRVWKSAMSAAEDTGVKITSADRTTGIIRGVTSSSDVTISVISQADGKTRVEFSSKGPKGQDPDLNDRFTRFYNRRMGR